MAKVTQTLAKPIDCITIFTKVVKKMEKCWSIDEYSVVVKSAKLTKSGKIYKVTSCNNM